MAKMRSSVVDPYKEDDSKVEYFNKGLGIVFNGEDNLRPLIIENMYDSSPTAGQCAWIYGTFIVGGGFETDLSNFNLSDKEWSPKTPNDLLYDVEESLARHQGFFMHVQYNGNYEKDSYKHIPYTLCRLGQLDSEDFAGKIAYSKKGWGLQLKKNEIKWFYAYNPDPRIIAKQVEADGGWENYRGQIMYFKLSDKRVYSTSLLENAYVFADVENNIGKYYSSTVKRNFEDTTIIRHKPFETDHDFRDFQKNIKSISGLENASSKLILEDEWDEIDKEGSIKFDTIKTDTKPDRYAHFEKTSANMIRKAHKNIPPQLVDYISGKLGNTSGEDLVKAQAVYNSLISRDQEKVEMIFKELFRNYKQNINPSNDWTIKQYKLLDDGTVDYD